MTDVSHLAVVGLTNLAIISGSYLSDRCTKVTAGIHKDVLSDGN
jgi:hypothetical protein